VAAVEGIHDRGISLGVETDGAFSSLVTHYRRLCQKMGTDTTGQTYSKTSEHLLSFPLEKIEG
jgi:hypothetical protein